MVQRSSRESIVSLVKSQPGITDCVVLVGDRDILVHRDRRETQTQNIHTIFPGPICPSYPKALVP